MFKFPCTGCRIPLSGCRAGFPPRDRGGSPFHFTQLGGQSSPNSRFCSAKHLPRFQRAPPCGAPDLHGQASIIMGDFLKFPYTGCRTPLSGCRAGFPPRDRGGSPFHFTQLGGQSSPNSRFCSAKHLPRFQRAPPCGAPDLHGQASIIMGDFLKFPYTGCRTPLSGCRAGP